MNSFTYSPIHEACDDRSNYHLNRQHDHENSLIEMMFLDSTSSRQMNSMIKSGYYAAQSVDGSCNFWDRKLPQMLLGEAIEEGDDDNGEEDVY